MNPHHLSEGMRQISTLLAQRSEGEVILRYGSNGVEKLREAGCSKIRVPKCSHEAILINTSGGLAGGDKLAMQISVAHSAQLVVTSQAAERVYRSLGPAATLHYRFDVAEGARFCWLPQETILFDGSSLSRQFEARVAENAELLLVESAILGRMAMGEQINQCHIVDHWDIYRGKQLIHAERFSSGPDLRRSTAALGAAQAIATLLLVSPAAADRRERVEETIGAHGAVSCWNGKLVARLAAEDGLTLRKALQRAIVAATCGGSVPRVWAL